MENVKTEKLSVNDFLKNRLTREERILKLKVFQLELIRLEGSIEVEEIDYFYQANLIDEMEKNKNNPNSIYLDSLKIVCDKVISPNLNNLDTQVEFGVYSSKELAEIIFLEKEILDIADILIKKSFQDKSVELKQGL